MRRAFKSAAKKVLSSRLLISKKARVVFLFHDVSDPGAEGHSAHYSTPPAAFREQIEFLHHAFDLVPLPDLHKARGNGKPLAGISFDDGFLSVLERAHPLLRSLRIPYTVFLNRAAAQDNRLHYSDRYPGLNRAWRGKVYLDEEDVRQMSREGVAFGSHTLSHPTLSEIGDAEARHEIAGNKAWLDHLLRQKTSAFAVPYGKTNHFLPRDVKLCREAGHTHIYTTIPGFFLPGEVKPAQHLIPRIPVVAERPESIIFSLNVAHIRRIL
ncbi:MAG: polysaccharide deacetylase family protein [Bdellovibrionales bacterium]|nr:polysaccharide deacetylase family protein [Bdellovibrionales bacterium]